MTATRLPRNPDGVVITSAQFGESNLVKIEWRTDFDGRVIPDHEPPAVTLHGPFVSEAEATEWIEACPDDTDVVDFHVIVINNVR